MRNQEEEKPGQGIGTEAVGSGQFQHGEKSSACSSAPNGGVVSNSQLQGEGSVFCNSIALDNQPRSSGRLHIKKYLESIYWP